VQRREVDVFLPDSLLYGIAIETSVRYAEIFMRMITQLVISGDES